MKDETLSPVGSPKKMNRPSAPKGRLADIIAASLAVVSAGLALMVALIFFLGFAANDTGLAGLASALAFSFGLAAFAVIPATIIAKIAYRGWREGLTKRNALWAIGLSLPWIILSLLVLTHAPLPMILSSTALLLSSLLCLWALISICLPTSRNIEVP